MTTPPPTESATDTNGSTLEASVSGPDTTTAQLLEQLSELETLDLSVPTLPADPREKEIQEQRRRQARLGEQLRRHATDRAREMDTDQLAASLQRVARQATYAERVLAWVWIHALTSHDVVDEALLQWQRKADTWRHRLWGWRHTVADVYVQRAPEVVLAALGYETVDHHLPVRTADDLALAGINRLVTGSGFDPYQALSEVPWRGVALTAAGVAAAVASVLILATG